MRCITHPINIAAILLCLAGCGKLDEFAKAQLEKESDETAPKSPVAPVAGSTRITGQIYIDQILIKQTQFPHLYMIDGLSEEDKDLFRQSGVFLSRIFQEAKDKVSTTAMNHEALNKNLLQIMMDKGFPEPLEMFITVNDQDFHYETDQNAIASYREHVGRISADDPLPYLKAVIESVETHIAGLTPKASQSIDNVELKKHEEKSTRNKVTFFGIAVTNASKVSPIVHEILTSRANLQWAESLHVVLKDLEQRMIKIDQGLVVSNLKLSELKVFAEWEAFCDANSGRLDALLAKTPGVDSRSGGTFTIYGDGELIAQFEFGGEPFYVLEGAEDLNAFKSIKRFQLPQK